ncbi:hypothetical protein BCR32DRAFT_271615 [Anaeromyces robustus]|uniref:Uncharacterized protein n=1 Tax=Anaeromyces robustus TaxID=1754192 RepID=A0A1Y1WQT4_9FUNG|nr:hypothetical protein BCR32DRAFT_271615 [Anaeromyces robustus]|eukprot:ORX75899.1 hypothetical protein BCR32DRAFT_271615 [Anaeromyces robustus]
MDNIRISIFDLNDRIHVNKGYLKAIEEPPDDEKNKNLIKEYVIRPWHVLSKILLYKLLSLDESIDEAIKKKIYSLNKKNKKDEWFDFIRKNYSIPPNSIYQISQKIPFTIQHQCQSLYNYEHSSQIFKVLYTPAYNGLTSFISLDPVYINIWKGTNLYKKIKRDTNKNYMKIKEWLWIDKQRMIVAFTDNMKLLAFKINFENIRDRNEKSFIKYSKLEIEDFKSDHFISYLYYRKKAKYLYAVDERSIYVYSYETNERIKTYNEIHQMSITEIVYCESKDYLITGGREGTIKVWQDTKLLYQFNKHKDAITSLIILSEFNDINKKEYNIELISTSLDGSIYFWNLDNWSGEYKFSVQQPIHTAKIISSNQFYISTRRTIDVLLYNKYKDDIFNVRSKVLSLKRVESNIKPARIVCISEDNSCRFISPVSGQSITIALPFLEDINIKKIAYSLDYDRLYILLCNSSIVVISTTTNPCRLIEEWGNSFTTITDIIIYDPSKSSENQDIMPYFLLGCSNAGQILIFDPACYGYTEKTIQAHLANITKIILNSQHDKLYSISEDLKLKIWSIRYINDSEKHDISIDLLNSIDYSELPSPIVDICLYETAEMIGAITAVGKLIIYNESDKSYKIGSDSTSIGICSFSCCEVLGIFATVDKEGCLKIWDYCNNLIREICLNVPIDAVEFLNQRGDIIIGYTHKLSIIKLENYIQLETMKYLLTLDLVDDQVEIPIDFDNNMKWWIIDKIDDIEMLRQKIKHDEGVLSNKLVNKNYLIDKDYNKTKTKIKRKKLLLRRSENCSESSVFNGCRQAMNKNIVFLQEEDIQKIKNEPINNRINNNNKLIDNLENENEKFITDNFTNIKDDDIILYNNNESSEQVNDTKDVKNEIEEYIDNNNNIDDNNSNNNIDDNSSNNNIDDKSSNNNIEDSSNNDNFYANNEDREEEGSNVGNSEKKDEEESMNDIEKKKLKNTVIPNSVANKENKETFGKLKQKKQKANNLSDININESHRDEYDFNIDIEDSFLNDNESNSDKKCFILKTPSLSIMKNNSLPVMMSVYRIKTVLSKQLKNYISPKYIDIICSEKETSSDKKEDINQQSVQGEVNKNNKSKKNNNIEDKDINIGYNEIKLILDDNMHNNVNNKYNNNIYKGSTVKGNEQQLKNIGNDMNDEKELLSSFNKFVMKKEKRNNILLSCKKKKIVKHIFSSVNNLKIKRLNNEINDNNNYKYNQVSHDIISNINNIDIKKVKKYSEDFNLLLDKLEHYNFISSKLKNEILYNVNNKNNKENIKHDNLYENFLNNIYDRINEKDNFHNFWEDSKINKNINSQDYDNVYYKNGNKYTINEKKESLENVSSNSSILNKNLDNNERDLHNNDIINNKPINNQNNETLFYKNNIIKINKISENSHVLPVNKIKDNNKKCGNIYQPINHKNDYNDKSIIKVNNESVTFNSNFCIYKNNHYINGVTCKKENNKQNDEKKIFNVLNVPTIQETFDSLFNILYDIKISVFEKCEIIKLIPNIYKYFSVDIYDVENFIINRLLDFIINPDWHIRFFVLATLPLYNIYNDNVILSILSCLNDENPYISKLSRVILGYFGIESKNDLINVFNERGYNRNILYEKRKLSSSNKNNKNDQIKYWIKSDNENCNNINASVNMRKDSYIETLEYNIGTFKQNKLNDIKPYIILPEIPNNSHTSIMDYINAINYEMKNYKLPKINN